jgi:DNA invertase Pin-like site-specific DNA recombinase
MEERRFVSYLRVSTDRQGRSGLGLEAQRQAIADYVRGQGGRLLTEHLEVESGKISDRPELKAALDACGRTGATLLIAKLDRLSRNVAFIASLMDGGVDFVACDFPMANRLTLHVLAAVAEHEREMISARTKAALQAAKARGVRLGNPRKLTPEAAENGRRAGVAARQRRADFFAGELIGDIRGLRAKGLSLNRIARRLNESEVLTPRGKVGGWTARAVLNAIARCEIVPSES